MAPLHGDIDQEPFATPVQSTAEQSHTNLSSSSQSHSQSDLSINLNKKSFDCLSSQETNTEEDQLKAISFKLEQLELIYGLEGISDSFCKERNLPLTIPTFKQIITKFQDHTKESSSLHVPKSTYWKLIDWLNYQMEISADQFILGYIYLERVLGSKLARQWVDFQNLKDLYCICVLLTFKYTNDTDFWPLSEFGKVAGLSFKSTYYLERYTLCNILDYSLYVSDKEFQNKKNWLLCQGKNPV